VIVSLIVLLVDVRLAASPEYLAATLCVPTVSVVVVQAAVRELPLPAASATTAQFDIDPAPSMKLMLPLGVLPVTVAVKVTLAPLAAGFAELTSVVIVDDAPPPPAFTIWETIPLEPVLPASPP
jgi:hypothetical protein